MLFVHRRSKSTQGIWSKSKGEGWTRFEIFCSYFQFLIFNDRQPEQHHRCFVKSLKHRRNRRVPDCYFGRFTGTHDIPKINNFDVITLGRVLPSNQFRLMRNPWGNSKIDEFSLYVLSFLQPLKSQQVILQPQKRRRRRRRKKTFRLTIQFASLSSTSGMIHFRLAKKFIH